MMKRRRQKLDLKCNIGKRSRAPLPPLPPALIEAPQWKVIEHFPLLLSLTSTPRPAVYNEDLLHAANASLHGLESAISVWDSDRMVFVVRTTCEMCAQASDLMRDCNIVGTMVRRLIHTQKKLAEFGQSATHRALSNTIASELHKTLRACDQLKTPLQLIRGMRGVKRKLKLLVRIVGCDDLSKPAILSKLPSSASLVNRAYSLIIFRDRILINELVQSWMVDLDRCLRGLPISSEFMIISGKLVEKNIPHFLPRAVAEAFAEASQCLPYLNNFQGREVPKKDLLVVPAKPFTIYMPGKLLSDAFEVHHDSNPPVIKLLVPLIRRCRSIRTEFWQKLGPQMRVVAAKICSEGLLQNGRLLTALQDGVVPIPIIESAPLVDGDVIKVCGFVRTWWLSQSPPPHFLDRLSFNDRMQRAANILDYHCSQLRDAISQNELSPAHCTEAFARLLSIPRELEALDE